MTLPHMTAIGDGVIFASSGFDGDTDSRSRFTGVLSDVRQADGALTHLAVSFHPGTRRRVAFHFPEGLALSVVLNDLVVGQVGGDEFILTYSNWHTLVARIPAGVDVTITDDAEGSHLLPPTDGVVEDRAQDDVMIARRDGGVVAVAYAPTPGEAVVRSTEGLAVDIAGLAARTIDWYDRLPSVADAASARLLAKCASVMRVNTLSAGDVVPTLWSTPDRVPHQHMWLWDSVFHSFGMNHLDPDAAWSFIVSVLNTQLPDGLIPHCYRIRGELEAISQPPVLAWGVWESYLRTGDVSHLEHAAPILDRYLDWFLQNRRDRSGLLTWAVDDDPNCRSAESGMDNSSRFDSELVSVSVDLNTFAARDMSFASRIAEEIGDPVLAQKWRTHAEYISSRIHGLLWDPDAGLYTDLLRDGSFSATRAVSGFLPVLLPDLPVERIEALENALADPEDFGTAVPIPSISRRDATFSTDMWRGPAWINMNYLVALGLREHGATETAARIVDATIRTVSKYYERYGTIFEFYDADDLTPPPRCYRKGPPLEHYDFEKKIDDIRDYHWSAALTLSMVLGRQSGSEDSRLATEVGAHA